jgi:hypothetical protein
MQDNQNLVIWLGLQWWPPEAASVDFSAMVARFFCCIGAQWFSSWSCCHSQLFCASVVVSLDCFSSVFATAQLRAESWCSESNFHVQWSRECVGMGSNLGIFLFQFSGPCPLFAVAYWCQLINFQSHTVQFYSDFKLQTGVLLLLTADTLAEYWLKVLAFSTELMINLSTIQAVEIWQIPTLRKFHINKFIKPSKIITAD